MSIGSSCGASACAEEMLKFIEEQGGKLEQYLGKPPTEEQQVVLGFIISELRSIKQAADSGWY